MHEEVVELLDELDKDGDGEINYRYVYSWLPLLSSSFSCGLII